MVTRKEKIFDTFDEIIDLDLTRDLTLKQYINRMDKSLQQRCIHTLGSVSLALEEYGMTDEAPSIELSFERLFDYLGHTFEIKDDGRVSIDFETYLRKINELHAMGYAVDSQKAIREIETYLEMDRVEAFMRTNDDEANVILDERKERKYPENQMISLTEKHFPSRLALYKTYGLHPLMLNGGKDFARIRKLMQLGRDFENIVGEVLSEIYSDIRVKPKFGTSIPDYVVDETWYDAKLARSTTLAPGCRTIPKYRKHTDNLTIIYALHDTERKDSRANFVHISEYYPLITDELQRKIDAFIRKATEVRFGESNRLSDV